MLRFLIVILLLANGLFAAWGQGWLAPIGWSPEASSEAWRLGQQMRPEAVQLQASAAAEAKAPPAASAPAPTTAADSPASPAAAPTEAAPAEAVAVAATDDAAPEAAANAALTSAPPATQCWQAGTFSQDEAVSLRSGLRNQELPWDSYELRTQEIAGRWMVYLGKFPSLDLLARQRASLRAQGVDTDRAGGTLEPGLSLGRFSSEEAATRELTRLVRSGVRGARVVQERATAQVFTLYLPAISTAQYQRLQSLPELVKNPLVACPADAAKPEATEKTD